MAEKTHAIPVLTTEEKLELREGQHRINRSIEATQKAQNDLVQSIERIAQGYGVNPKIMGFNLDSLEFHVLLEPSGLIQ